jgi:branched-chain amino acid transport system substrate-binding protein
MKLLRTLLAAVGLGCVALAAQSQDIKIGNPGPVTGPVAVLGQQMKWGAEQAVEEINRAGGVLGRHISYVMQDSACRPGDSVAATERLLSQDKVDVVFGDLCSGATLALMPLIEKAGRPMIVAISTLPELTQKAGVGGNKWVFRTVPDDTMMAAVIAKQMKPFKTVAFLAEDTDYGRGGIKLLREKLGPDVKVISEDYVKQTENDFLPVFTRLRSAKPDAIVVYMLDQQTANMMKQYAQFGLTAPLVGRPALVSPLVSDLLATGKFNGSWTVYPYYDKFSSPPNDAFTKAFTQKFKQPPHYVAYSTYEAIHVVADAIKRAGSVEPNAVREALVKSNYKGILGNISFDQHDQSHNNLMYMLVENGKLGVKELVSGQ